MQETGGDREARPGSTRMGRYSLLHELGRGGMGVTHVAHDEELDRKVAIKLVRADVMDESAQQRLRREAQALARLAHPNIVAVHDVGTHGAQSFIAMELVPGQTLSAWLVAQPRAWTEVLAVFRQVGEGLRAAHAAGLVHRDVKPANIMVGDDGRVRVLDFGLARLDGPGEAEVQEEVPEIERRAVASSEPLTETGSLVGTLAYMAPEQIEHGVADARSDQFAFCVSLFEALYGRQPFSGASPRARLNVMRQGAIAEVPDECPVPAWLHAVIVRGLAFAPEDRWPSMDALLAALQRDPPRARRRIAMLATGALAVAVAAGAFAAARDPVCSGAQEQIDEVWSHEQRLAIQRAMLTTGVPYAGSTWQRTEAVLDRYAADWIAAHTGACEATAVRREQSEEVLDQRMTCLAGRRRSLRALVGELAHVDRESIARATEAAGRLPLIASCADLEYLASRIEPPAEPAAAAQVEALEAELSRAEQLQELGRYEDGHAAAQAVFDRAVGLGHPSLESRARLRLGMLQLVRAAYQPAEDNLQEAYFLARTAGDHEVALQAATQLVFLLGFHLSRLDEAGVWGRHVEAELAWVRSETARASSLNTLGGLALVQGKHDRAFELCSRALSFWEQVLGPDHPENANALNNLGMVHHAQGRYAESAAMHRRALAIRERALGATHPRVARSLNNLGGALYFQGSYAEAIPHYARGLAITEQALGAVNPFVADPLIGMALSYLGQGRAAEAVPLAERALAVLEQHRAGAGTLAEARFALARALVAARRDAPRALALARQARDAMQAAPGALSLITLADVESWLRAHDPAP
jgi:tetratricopeptide (TPR) repeat protein/tRNA A-37 threonylcarbamoyl transferase component Bud32